MEEGDLPIGAGCRELLLEPLDLLRRRVGAVESEEADVRLRAERVVELPFHVERLVESLLARVVVAQRRVELHAAIQQRLVGQLKLLVEVLRPLRARAPEMKVSFSIVNVFMVFFLSPPSTL